jgi:Zn-dependent protease with chaperone function
MEMDFVVRRSLPTLSGLLAVVLAVGVAAVLFLHFPVWFPAMFAIVVIGVQFAINPWVIEWLVPAVAIRHNGVRYDTDHVVGEIVARRCRDAGVPLVRLGIVNDGNPNAFTFGHTPKDARMYLTRGLLERLDERELDAVVTHEVGHIKHWDFAVMTVAAVVPMVCYLVFLMTRRSRNGGAVAIGAYVAYWVAQLTVLTLSRARELAADHWSCDCTRDGDALASALVKIAYGMGEVRAQERAQAQALLATKDKHARREAARLEHHSQRASSMRALGIFDPRLGDEMAAILGNGADGRRAIAAMRWDVCNPWGRTLELLSTHPLVAHRITALASSGLPGAPRQWGALAAAAADPGTSERLHDSFRRELAVAVAPWALLALAVFTLAATGSATAIAGGVVIAAGAAFWYKQLVRYPTDYTAVAPVTTLLERVDAGPVAGIAVEVRGRLIGRGTPGYVLSPDLVVADDAGFVPLAYRQPVPVVASFFGLLRVPDWLGHEVVARGWYRRMPSPVIELRDVRAVDGTRRSRTWRWVARYACAAVVVLVGVVMLAANLA